MPVLLLLLACTAKDAPPDSDDNTLVLFSGFGVDAVTGTSEAAVENDACAGWFPAEPQHLMTLDTNLLLTWIEADTAELVFYITYDQSTFCAEADGGLPRVERGTWSAGEYEIYVGSAGEGGGGVAYTLTATEG